MLLLLDVNSFIVDIFLSATSPQHYRYSLIHFSIILRLVLFTAASALSSFDLFRASLTTFRGPLGQTPSLYQTISA